VQAAAIKRSRRLGCFHLIKGPWHSSKGWRCQSVGVSQQRMTSLPRLCAKASVQPTLAALCPEPPSTRPAPNPPDPEKREIYDQYGEEGLRQHQGQQGGGRGGPGNIFDFFFGGGGGPFGGMGGEEEEQIPKGVWLGACGC
jgi:hypothetical protein